MRAETKTATTNGEVVAVSRRDHLCAALDVRLGFTDVCGLDAVAQEAQPLTVPHHRFGPAVRRLRPRLDDAGSAQPADAVLSRRHREHLHVGRRQVIDVAASQRRSPASSYWSSTTPDAAIADFVGTVMGLVPSDPRAAQATTLLKAHFTAAHDSRAPPPRTRSNRRSSSACQAPSAVSIGL